MNLSSKWLKRISVLTMMMVATLSITVFAANVAEVTSSGETVGYESFVDAVTAAESGDTIKVLAEIDLGETGNYSDGNKNYGINIAEKALTLDLNGNTIKSKCNYATIRINSDAELTIIDSSEAQTGKVSNNVEDGEALENFGTLTIEAGTYGSDEKLDVYAMMLENNSTTTIEDGTFNGIIYTNGNRVNACELTINDGTFTRMFYLAGAGNYEFNSGDYTGDTTLDNAIIEVRRGTLAINGGTYEFDIDTTINETAEIYGNGSGYYQGTIIVSKTDGYVGDLAVTIKDATISNTLGDAIVMANESETLVTTATIEDAEITGNITNYIETNESNTITVEGGFVNELNAVVEVINGSKISRFNTLEEAVEYAADGATIKLLAEIDLGETGNYSDGSKNYGINIAEKALTLDLNGNKIKSTCNYATIRVNSDAELTIIDSSAAQTGKVSSNVELGAALENYGKLTVNAGTYGTDNDLGTYSFVFENETTNIINGGTFETAIYCNGSRVNNSTLTVNDGKFTNTIYLAGAGTYEFNSGDFMPVGKNSAIEIKRGTLTINGGNYQLDIDTASNEEAAVYGNGSGTYKGIIVVAKKDTYAGNVSLEIKGGTFTNNLGDAIVMANESTTLVSTIEIENATVTGAIAYYGIKSTVSGDSIETENNITLKGSVAESNDITVYANSEVKAATSAAGIETLIAKEVTITYVYDNGSEDKVVSGIYGGTVPTEANPTRTGYKFTGWDKEIPTEFPEENITITALWEKKVVASGGGSSSSVIKYRITVGQKDGGKISPETLKVEKGEDQTFTIKADEGYEIVDVLVDGESVGAVEEYTFENVKTTHKITAEFRKIEEVTEDTSGDNLGDTSGDNMEDTSGDNLEETTNNTFTDVKEEDWYYESVKFVTENGLFNGVTEDSFAPNKNLTRGMLVTVLYRHAKADVKEAAKFDDVKEDMYYSNPIAWASANGIVNGTGDNSFAPDKEITREQLVTILYRYAQFMNKDVSVGENTNILSYEDYNENSEYAIPALQWACGSGIMNGRTESTLAPKGTATRAEVATMLMRFCQ